MSKISIIIPVYNCSEYLERCVQSVFSQTYSDLQIILVDDGSSDDSGVLCDGFAQQDPRVTVIHQKNAGVSAARNAGLAAATGDFIGFVDADDFIEPDTYCHVLSQIGDCDMAMWDAVTLWDDGRREADTISRLQKSCIVNKSDWTPELLGQMAGAVWRCLYRRELLQDVRFPVGIKLSEDRLFNIEAMGKANKLAYSKRAMYIRYVRQGSAVNRYHEDRFEKSVLAMEIAEKTIRRYWHESYLGIYARMLVIDGALMSIYEICSRSFTGKGRIQAIRSITGQLALMEILRRFPQKDLRGKLLKYRANRMLWAAGVVFNWKNR